MARPDWARSVFTSEVAFLLHLPLFISYGGSPSRMDCALFAARVGIHTIAVPLLLWDARHNMSFATAATSAFAGTYSYTGGILVAVSAALYAATYITHVLRRRARPCVVQPVLFGIAHLSVINFLLDLPGRGIPSQRRSHLLLVAVNLVGGLILVVTAVTATPLRNAWGCYAPEYVQTVKDYNRGICPDDHSSSANICTERPYTNCEEEFRDDIFAREIHYGLQICSFSVPIYLLTLSTKLAFYKREIKADA